ncbi:hypothetical protein SISNIDRAFT_475296 [Sistotremastrum niveocremeum HHB9708]|uniref:Ubiquitin-like domain-containing protein n=1 Tax=Sistotremastrum niveocremeum HHB9708 TaxID=1314777 RepID=A0A164RAP2_9AGAM|nr:hypothetical protein SISNIDRAFT_475296 [Sistotremastrum niveocremeum HHB9708]
MPLSEKAKGKRKATEDSIKVPSPPPPELIIRFTEGVQDLKITVDPSQCVGDIKNLIREHRPLLSKRRLRLIYLGRLLSDEVSVRTLSADAPASLDSTTSTSPTTTGGPSAAPSVWIQCAIGPALEEGEEDVTRTQQAAAQLTPLRGFDRLANAGMSDEEIAVIRRQFHAESGLSSEDFLENDLGEEADYEERAHELEERWLDSMDMNALHRGSGPSSAGIIQGLFLGFFFPLLPFFFFRATAEPTFWEDGRMGDRPRSVLFSKRTQMAIVLGFVVNLTIGIWKKLLTGT